MPIEVPRAHRFPLQLVLRYRRGASAAWQEGRTENISSSGVLFVAGDVPEVDTPIEMTLVMPSEIAGAAGASVRCVGRVVRTVAPDARDGQGALAASITEYRLVRGGRC